mmetsp:Transcript_53734/g.79855  ORF Transcript_53734/g.79855 Transcript_53734/m.79855 type:complete len:305 (-) Transcript_53734:82-996(-)|eukprot:CAMPEP_0195524712 /NCGR_PEP_ID=MMETSP0794_2-20130614/24722_1 /TAXON_ID=515487 /ORGANISM="Stephanopyxis turris, Strain CCMP 815" /LENGTH=304 /DNA_ID=CAMNT_0040654991 /DNA_START=169 /DNA_END=1083 /DNA_ORIENTATION=+
MSFRDLTKDFLRHRLARQTAGGAPSPTYSRSERDSARDRLTDPEQDAKDLEAGIENDDNGHRQWMDYRDAVENNFYELNETLDKMRTAHTEALEELDQKRYQAESEKLAARVTDLLRDTDRSIKRVYVEDLLSDDAQENSIRKNVQIELSQKLYNITVEFRKAQKEYMKKKMEQDQTRARGTTTYIDEKTAAEDISEDMIQELATTSNLINERDQEIANIAKSVQEIAEMFRDLSGLIIEQGTVLDRIDYNLEVALDRTKSGVVHLEEAEKEQKKNRAVKCVFCLTVTSTACLVVYILKKTNKF